MAYILVLFSSVLESEPVVYFGANEYKSGRTHTIPPLHPNTQTKYERRSTMNNLSISYRSVFCVLSYKVVTVVVSMGDGKQAVEEDVVVVVADWDNNGCFHNAFKMFRLAIFRCCC